MRESKKHKNILRQVSDEFNRKGCSIVFHPNLGNEGNRVEPDIGVICNDGTLLLEVEHFRSINSPHSKMQMKAMKKFSKEKDILVGVTHEYLPNKVCILPLNEKSNKFLKKKDMKLCTELTLTDFIE